MGGEGGREGRAANNDSGVTPTPSNEQTEHSTPNSLVKPAATAVAALDPETGASASNDANTKLAKVAKIEDRMGLENGTESTKMIQKDLADRDSISCNGPSESKGGCESSEARLLGASSPAAICGLAFKNCPEMISDRDLLEIHRRQESSEPQPEPMVTLYPLSEPPSPATAFKGPTTPPLALSDPTAGIPQKMQPKSAQDPKPVMTKVSNPEITQVPSRASMFVFLFAATLAPLLRNCFANAGSLLVFVKGGAEWE